MPSPLQSATVELLAWPQLVPLPKSDKKRQAHMSLINNISRLAIGDSYISFWC
jgi:hypothetical protein